MAPASDVKDGKERFFMYDATRYQSPIGPYLIACDGKSIVGVWAEGQKHFGAAIKGQLHEGTNAPVLEAAKDWLDRYFAGQRPLVSKLRLNPAGSEFRREVWKILCSIPYGEVMTYGEIAKQMAVILHRKSMSGQAVGGAVANNPISIIIPCHRVVGSTGSLTGYAGGIACKIKLMEHDGMDMSRFTVPTKGTAL